MCSALFHGLVRNGRTSALCISFMKRIECFKVLWKDSTLSTSYKLKAECRNHKRFVTGTRHFIWSLATETTGFGIWFLWSHISWKCPSLKRISSQEFYQASNQIVVFFPYLSNHLCIHHNTLKMPGADPTKTPSRLKISLADPSFTKQVG